MSQCSGMPGREGEVSGQVYGGAPSWSQGVEGWDKGFLEGKQGKGITFEM